MEERLWVERFIAGDEAGVPGIFNTKKEAIEAINCRTIELDEERIIGGSW